MCPLYDYQCPDHDITVERLVAVADRDKVQVKCQQCGKLFKRVLTAATIGKPKEGMKAILGSGEKVKGDWG